MSTGHRERPSQADAAREWAERRRKKKDKQGQSYGRLAKAGAARSILTNAGLTVPAASAAENKRC